MRALFAPASGPEVGGGHVLRGLALASALRDRGAACTFVVEPWGARLVKRFSEGQPFALLPRRADDPLAGLVAAHAPDLLVLDDYGLDRTGEAALAAEGRTLLVIDDLADRPHGCDLLLDPGFGRRAQDYRALVPVGCQVLAGPAYALLRPAFARASSPTRTFEGEVGRVFVSFGLSDVGRVAFEAVQRLRPLKPRAVFDVALASDAPSLEPLSRLAERDPGLRLHPDARDVAALMRGADVAVGAGGASTWERCALGLPTLAVAVAQNQQAMIAALAKAGVVLAADMAEGRLEAAFLQLCAPAVRRRLSDASRALCDGRGAERAAEAILHGRAGGAPFSAAGTQGS